jgi:magnesium transporter
MQVLDSVDADAIRALHERGEFFWLDLHSPTDAQLDELGPLLEIPGLALEDTKEFGQRPKLDDYQARVLIVFYGAHERELVEVHVHVSGDEVVTVRRDQCAHLQAAKARLLPKDVRTEQDLVYRILDALADSLRVLVSVHAIEVEGLEEIAFQRPTPDERRRLSQLRSDLFRLQQTIVPERDMLAHGGEVLEHLPGLERDVARHKGGMIVPLIVATVLLVRAGYVGRR